jgi:hypothetical protein
MGVGTGQSKKLNISYNTLFYKPPTMYYNIIRLGGDSVPDKSITYTEQQVNQVLTLLGLVPVRGQQQIKVMGLIYDILSAPVIEEDPKKE